MKNLIKTFLFILSISTLSSAFSCEFPAETIKKGQSMGLELPEKYPLCNNLYAGPEGDHKLPTGYVQAIENGGVYVDLWKAELHIQKGNYVPADILLSNIIKNNPENPEAYWLRAKNLYNEALRQPEEDTETKGVIFEQGYQAALKCVELAPENFNCVQHAGGLLGRKMTNAGIFSVIFNASKVEAFFTKAYELSDKGSFYRYASGHTSKGVSSFALGIMYRLAPHTFFMRLLSPVDGDIGLSVKYTRAALEQGGFEPEYYMELGVSLLCQHKLDDNLEAKAEGEKILNKCLSLPEPTDPIRLKSYKDCKKVLEDPSLACGYSKDRQQEAQ